MRKATIEWCTALSVVVLLLPFTKGDITLAGNEASRLATADALVEDGTFAIDGSVFHTVDMVHVGSREYSDKPPLLSLFLAGVYRPLHAAGLSFRDPQTRGVAIRLLVILGMIPFAAGTAVVLARRLRGLGFGAAAAGVSGFLAVASTWLLTFGVTISNHVAAAFLLVSMYAMMSDHVLTTMRCVAGGVLAGLLLHVEPATGGVTAVVTCACVAALARRFAGAAAFAIAFLVLVAAFAGLNRWAHGSVLPAYLLPYGYVTPRGVVQASPAGLMLGAHPVRYAWHILLGTRGVFSHHPALLLAAVPVAHALHRGRPFLRASSCRGVLSGGVLATALVVSLVAACVATTSDYGGWAYGCRYLVSIVPLLFLFSCLGARQLVRAAGTRRAAIPWAVALAVGIVTSAVGAWNPWPVCFEGEATEARIRAGSRSALLDARARSPFLANALCIAVARRSPAADGLARAALDADGADDPVARAYLTRAFRNLGRGVPEETAGSSP